MSTKTIRVSEQTYQKLTKLGTFGDSFDSVIKRLAENSLSSAGDKS